MTAVRQRLKSAIRNIALTPEERRQLLGDGANKGGQPSAAGVGTSEAEESRLCCDGSTAPPNAGTTARDPDAEGAGQSGLDPNDPAKLTSGDGTLSGVVDCATGEPVCMDGSGHIPPDGWDDPNEPPVDPTYEDGIYYLSSSSGPFALPMAAAEAAIREATGSCFDENCVLTGYQQETESIMKALYINSFGNESSRNFTRKQCINEYDAICDEPPPIAESWPSDGCVNLAVKGGSIVGSKYDPENGGAYSKPMSEINLCDGAGNQIRLAPSADGGWKTLDAINGGDGYLYDSQGQQIARISGDEFSDPTI